MNAVEDVIHGAKVLSSLGANGFILFSIVVVALMFVLLFGMLFFVYKSAKEQHVENEKKISRLKEDLGINKAMNKQCEKRLSIAINKLENCTDRLVGMVQRR